MCAVRRTVAVERCAKDCGSRARLSESSFGYVGAESRYVQDYRQDVVVELLIKVFVTYIGLPSIFTESAAWVDIPEKPDVSVLQKLRRQNRTECFLWQYAR